MQALAPEKWKRSYPCFEGPSARGPFFIPDEKHSFARLQLFDGEEFSCNWIELWVELKGHCLEIYEHQDAKDALLVFDLKETSIFAAAKGLPGSAPDLSVGRIALFSRYYFNKSVSSNCFFLEFPTPQDGKAWCQSLQLNREWALRQSALMHPIGSCQVYCESFEGCMVVRKRFSNAKMKSWQELHSVDASEGKVEKLGGSKLEGRFQIRQIDVKDGDKLEYTADGSVKGDINLSRATVIIVCNDVLTKSKARKKPKPTEAVEHVNWFGVTSEGDDRVFVFRCPESDDVERWCVSLSNLSKVDRDRLSMQIVTKQEQAKKNPTKKVRYVGHPLPESSYPIVPRGGIAVHVTATSSTNLSVQNAKDIRRKSAQDFKPEDRNNAISKARPIPLSPRLNSNNNAQDIDVSPRKSPVQHRTVGRGAGAMAAVGGGGVAATAGIGSGISAVGSGSNAANAASRKVQANNLNNINNNAKIEEADQAEGAFQRLRRATQMMKDSSAARSVRKGVTGNVEEEDQKQQNNKNEEAQKAEMRRAAALERKKLRDERQKREKMQQQNISQPQQQQQQQHHHRLQKNDEDIDGNDHSGFGNEISTAELQTLKNQLEAEIERRAEAEANNERLKEKMESDKAASRQLKQLAKDYRSKYEDVSKEVDTLKSKIEELQEREQELIDQHEIQIANSRRDNASVGKGSGSSAMLEQMTEEISVLKDALEKAKAEARTNAREAKANKSALESLEKEMDKLQEENDLLLGEVEQAEQMQEAVEGILALGDPAELVAQLEELLVENEALNNEVATLQKKLGKK